MPARRPPSNQTREELKARVRRFWDAKPCGLENTTEAPGTRGFYEAIESHRYKEEFHIPLLAEFEQHPGERILEIGGGVGTDGRQFAKSTRYYFDADLSFNSLVLAKQGFRAYGLPGAFVNTDAESCRCLRTRWIWFTATVCCITRRTLTVPYVKSGAC